MRREPTTIMWWWWLPCLISIGLYRGGSETEGIIVACTAVAFAWWFYSPDDKDTG